MTDDAMDHPDWGRDPTEDTVGAEGGDDDSAVPFPARRAMQIAIWEDCIRSGGNEWTTWSDAIILAETAAKALTRAGWDVLAMAGSPPPAPGPTEDGKAWAERVRAATTEVLDADEVIRLQEQGGVQATLLLASSHEKLRALLSTQPATTVLWEQETRPTDGDPAKSYIAPPLLDCPPGTHVVVTRRDTP